MESGYLALVLNAHLPFVRRPEVPRLLEERWFFEAISETYLPLLRCFRRLEAEGLPFKLTMSLSPTLCAMLEDEVLAERYVEYLEGQSALARAELGRAGSNPAIAPLARLYLELYAQARSDFESLYSRDLLSAFDYYYKKGKIELWTTGATHAFLPVYRDEPEAVAAQVETAIVSHRRAFGKHPAGFWLPQLGWHPGVDDILRSYNVQYTVVTTRGALIGEPAPRFGSFAPLRTPGGLTVFVRDAEATRAVWSESEGYPADPVYRDFYRDLGFDLPLDVLRPFLYESGERYFTGFKYWAVTGKTEDKRPYDPAAAAARAAEHAQVFLAAREASAKKAGSLMSRPPLMVCTYDAELFGHWWFEGPIWLEALFRKAAEGRGPSLLTLGEYHKLYPDNQESIPEFSSWGDGGYADVWIDGSNDWIYRHCFKAVERMRELAERFPDESGLRERILNQAAREVLLAMCSDWALLMRAGRSGAFAASQVEDAISNFDKIYDMLCSNTVGTEWLTRLEKRDNIFPDMNYRMFRRKR